MLLPLPAHWASRQHPQLWAMLVLQPGTCRVLAMKGLHRACRRAPGQTNSVCLLPAQACKPGMRRCQAAVWSRWKAPAFPGTTNRALILLPLEHVPVQAQHTPEKAEVASLGFIFAAVPAGRGKYGSSIPGGGTGLQPTQRKPVHPILMPLVQGA